MLLKLKRGLGADDAWLENRWKFPQFSVFANKGRCLIFGILAVYYLSGDLGYLIDDIVPLITTNSLFMFCNNQKPFLKSKWKFNLFNYEFYS